ncbi:MAG: DoxX family protein [Actinomycetota bacterium]
MARFLKSRADVASLTLAGLLAGTGVTHFVLPGFYDAIIPPLLPGPRRAWTLVSGVAELACAAAVANPRTRRVGASIAAVLFVAVFPANLQMAWNWRHRSGMDQAIAYARLPLQVPLVLWALAVRLRSPRRP